MGLVGTGDRVQVCTQPQEFFLFVSPATKLGTQGLREFFLEKPKREMHG